MWKPLAATRTRTLDPDPDPDPDPGVGGVCSRTRQVRDAIVAASPVTTCSAVTDAHLATITELDLSSASITSLQAGDFSGLPALTRLLLEDNQLSILPAGVFAGLSALTDLHLYANRLNSVPADVFSGLSSLRALHLSINPLSSVPADVFSGLSSLRALDLQLNQLSSLPEGVFSGLSSLRSLILNGNQLSSLPAGVFSGLSSLRSLILYGNQLSSLPDGVFAGLSSLTGLSLDDNLVDPLPVTVSLVSAGPGAFKATAHTGAPFNMVVPVSVANGAIDGGSATVTIPAGSVESGPLAVTRTPGATGAMTADIGTLPGLPTNVDSGGTLRHQGYALVKSADLPLDLDIVAITPTAGVNGFTDDPLVPGVTPVKAVHFRELRTRIDALRTGAGLPAFAWTDRALTPGVTAVRRVHLTELRTALDAAYAAAGQPSPAYTDAAIRPGTTPIRAAHVTELRTAVVELENAAPSGLMPDLVVGPPTVTDSTLTPGQSFTLSVTVRNQGTAPAVATTLRYYRSSDATISTSDTAAGTDPVSGLAAGASGPESIGLTAPDSAGTYYYGACVEPVSGESDTGNNCSAGVRVTVGSGGGTAALEVTLTECSASAIGSLYSIDMKGTVRALRNVSEVFVRGWVGDYAIRGPDYLGSIRAGQTENFSLFDVVDLASVLGRRCRVEVTFLTSSGRTLTETTSVSEMGLVR